MANLKESEPLVFDHPSHVMMRVLEKVADMPAEDLNGRKNHLKFDQGQVHHAGEYRYDLLVGKTDEGQEYISIELSESNEFLVESAWMEKSHSEVIYEGTGKTPVRTGYFTITENNIWEHDPTDIYQGSTYALDDLLKLHFPDHHIEIFDTDR